MRRALPLLLLLSCARREEREQARPPAGEVWLSRQQLDSQQMRIGMIDEQQIASTLEAVFTLTRGDRDPQRVLACEKMRLGPEPPARTLEVSETGAFLLRQRLD